MKALKSKVSVLSDSLAICFIYLFPQSYKSNSLKKLADKEISKLKNKNPVFKDYKETRSYSFVNFIDAHKFSIIITLIFLLILSVIVKNMHITEIYIPKLGTFKLPSFLFLNIENPNNLHSVMATIQATIFALIIPITVALHEFVLKDNKLKNEMISFILKESKVKLITINSLSFLIWIVIIELVRTIFKNFTDSMVSQIIETFWISFNLILMGYFTFKTLNLLNRSFFDNALRRFMVNEIYPNELKGYLERSIYLNLTSYENPDETKKVIPKVFVNSNADLGAPEVILSIPNPMFLTDINLTLLKFVIKRWKKRNISSKEKENQSPKQPVLYFPLSLERQYQDTVILCRIDNGTPLSFIEKFAIKHAFKFSRASSKHTDLNSIKSFQMLIEHAAIIAHQLNESLFSDTFIELIKLHSLLLKLGETTDPEGNPINYAIVEASWLGTRLHNEWERAYQRLFDASVGVLTKSEFFFGRCCSIAFNIAQEILKNPSITGMDSITRMQGHLWFQLNKWWESKCEKIGLTPHIGNPVTLKPPFAKIHKKALKHFVEGWESLLRWELAPHIETINTWDAYKSLFYSLNEHLHSTILFLGKSVLSGNKESAYYWTDLLVHWNKYSQPLGSRNEFWFTDEIKEILITPSLLNMPWEEIEKLIQFDMPILNHQTTQRDIFLIILKNYWRDCCFILSNYLLSWAKNIPISESLPFNILKRLIEGKTIDNSDSFEKSLFFQTREQYFSSFIRRQIDTNYIGRLSERIEQLLEPERFSGRIYSFSKSANENNYETELIMSTLKLDYSSFFESLEKILISNDITYTLEQAFDNIIEFYEKNNFDEYAEIYKAFHQPAQEKDINYEEVNENAGKIAINNNQQSTFENTLKNIIKIFNELGSIVKEVRLNQIKALPISIDKLTTIAEEASDKIFSKETSEFPIALFDQITLVNEPLIGFKLQNPKFPKGQLTEPPMNDSFYSADFHNKAVSSRLYPHLIFNIINEAKKENIYNSIPLTSEEEYLAKLLELSIKLISDKLNPVIIIDYSQPPKFISNWKRAKWDSRVQIPHGITIDKKENNFSHNYIFHFNNIPVYGSYAATKSIMILPQEILKTVKFQQFTNGYPVEIKFDENPDNPWVGTLTYHWERAVELNTNYILYEIVMAELHPQPETTS
jgi:hypothetical protein